MVIYQIILTQKSRNMFPLINIHLPNYTLYYSSSLSLLFERLNKSVNQGTFADSIFFSI